MSVILYRRIKNKELVDASNGERSWHLSAHHDSLTWERHVCIGVWRWECFALPNAVRSHKRSFISSYWSNYVPKSVAACLYSISQTELCTGYVMIFHVPLLTYKYICIYICLTYNYIYMYIHTHTQHIMVYIYIYIYTQKHIMIHTHTYIYIYIVIS